MYCVAWYISESSPLGYRATTLVLLMLGNCKVQRTTWRNTLLWLYDDVRYQTADVSRHPRARLRTVVVITSTHVCISGVTIVILRMSWFSFTNRSSGPTIPQVTCVHFSRGPLSFSRSPMSITHIPVRLALPVLFLFVASSVSSAVYVLHLHLFDRGSTFRILYSSYVEHHTAVRLLFTALRFCWKRLERKEQFHCLPLFIYYDLVIPV